MGDDHQDDADTNEKRLNLAFAEAGAELLKASKSRRAIRRELEETKLLCSEFDECSIEFQSELQGRFTPPKPL